MKKFPSFSSSFFIPPFWFFLVATLLCAGGFLNLASSCELSLPSLLLFTFSRVKLSSYTILIQDISANIINFSTKIVHKNYSWLRWTSVHEKDGCWKEVEQAKNENKIKKRKKDKEDSKRHFTILRLFSIHLNRKKKHKVTYFKYVKYGLFIWLLVIILYIIFSHSDVASFLQGWPFLSFYFVF